MSEKSLLAIISIIVLVFVAGIVYLFVSSNGDESGLPDLVDQGGPDPIQDSALITDTQNGTGASNLVDQPESSNASGKEAIKSKTPIGALAGRVLDNRDRPVPGATVTLYKSVPSVPMTKRIPMHISAASDAKGRYTLSSIPVDTGYALLVQSRDFASAEMEGLSVAPDRTITVADFRLGKGFSIEGRVTDPSGASLVEVEVKAVDKIMEMAGMSRTAHTKAAATGPDGRFELPCLSQSQYEITFTLAGYRSLTMDENFILSGDDEKPRVMDVQLYPTGLLIKGTVEGPERRPVQNAEVTALFASPRKNAHSMVKALSDQSGCFVLAGVSEGKYSLRVTGKGYFQVEPILVDAGTEDVVVAMSPTGSVEGRLQAAAKLPGSYEVRIASFTPTVRIFGQNRVSKINGGPKALFRFTDLFPGKYAFLVEARGFAQSLSEEVEVRSGEITRDLVVALSLGGTLQGKVQDSKGNPVSGAQVDLMDKAYDPVLPFEEFFMVKPEQGKSCRTDARGAFALDHVMAGLYSLKIEAEGMARSVVKNSAVDEGAVSDLGLIVLTRGGGIKGTAYDENGKPSGGTKVSAASRQTGNRKAATTDDKGRFELMNLAPGPYELSLTLKGLWTALKYDTSVTVVVYEDKITQADIFTRLAERKQKKDP